MPRRLLLLCALPLLAAPPASAQEVVFEEHVSHEPFSRIDFFPCLGNEGMADDEALITGVESRNIKITAAGVDASGNWIPPFRVHATFHQRATVDPLVAGLPTYSGRSRTVFLEQVSDLRRHLMANARFRATASDGSGSLGFRVQFRLVVDPHGVVRVSHDVAECRTT